MINHRRIDFDITKRWTTKSFYSNKWDNRVELEKKEEEEAKFMNDLPEDVSRIVQNFQMEKFTKKRFLQATNVKLAMIACRERSKWINRSRKKKQKQGCSRLLSE